MAKDWYKYPEKKHVVWFSIVWIIGATLTILADTNLFRESLLQSKYLMTDFTLLFSLIALVRIYVNYYHTAEAVS